MASLLSSLGLRATNPLSPLPSHAASYLIFHFLFAYGVLSSRTLKQIYGLDHNVSPREDLGKYGPEAVKSGKITQKQLDMMKRTESASANSVEHYTLFVASMLWAQMTGLPNAEINASALVYTLARVVYAAVYVLVDRPALSQIRGLMWWTSNLVCFRLLWLGGTAINRTVALS
ncbi:hypothetical protein BAUCODRAFT_253474 [Baudoinia panamericana UAMH 10762]|uniref:MAPEG family protein n=1 Tax=Baudoinia panamericana (strain UAMH 10762) TaxID=717646 RepID=M2MB49_BAUPA|nr:uncharacterized protein BAUCODRAFT_253474 [Baudoinia panamericana UAMH 10762]EMC93706.1 hypothetical protein BAUCODRAFT_253474 [Baudoinia panamericana UAMH 10762]